MEKEKEPVEVDIEIEEEDDSSDTYEDRNKDWSGQKRVREQLADLYSSVVKVFEDKKEQNDTIEECWDVYQCKVTSHQMYSGNSQVFLPLVRDAVNARETRFTNTLFPKSGRYCDVVSSDGTVPYDLIAMLEYYCRTTSLRTNVVPVMTRGGDISGQYNIYMSWETTTRNIVSKKKVVDPTAPVDGEDTYDDVEYEEDEQGGPSVEVLDSRDLGIWPTNVDNIDHAEGVAVRRYWSKSKLKKMVREGTLEKEPVDILIANMNAKPSPGDPDTPKDAAQYAGVYNTVKGGKLAIVYEVWSTLKIGKEHRRMVSHFAGQNNILSCKRNPYWNDRVPVLTCPVEKIANTIWGSSQVKPVCAIQYSANDVVNEGFDSAQYSLLPIVMTDPEKNPRVGSMVMSMAAIWETSPNDTKFAQMPPLWRDAFQIVNSCRDQIQQSLGINPAMIPMGNASKKPSQAQVAQEQMVALETTADAVSILQEGILNKVLEWFYDLDYQFRTKAITVKKFGQVGIQADMQQVEPFQERQRLTFSWYGAESTKAAQDLQGMISWVNVLKGMPPQVLNGRTLDLGPALEYATEVILGPRLGPKTLIDERHKFSMQPQEEDALMDMLFPVQVHEGDDDMQHLQTHTQHFQMTGQDAGDPDHQKRGHILEHIKQLKEKAAKAQGAQQPQPGPPQQPGQPGMPPQGGPRPGAMAQPPTGGQAPPGAIHPDQMPTSMPG
jgi:hypothetical protein